ncbi:hypothetical protein ABEB36_013208 [Hypothenemus hampei]|uniref:Uncharacterized protein n=1 Tax=Hypothenemus hampei TaxID=57062 RepID=A0ABD1E7G2_HYPHA
MFKFFVCVALVAIGALAIPVKDELMFEGPDDTATVESTVREARAAPKHIGDLLKPGVKDAFLYVYGDDEDGEGDVHGYSKRIDDRGQDGYKHRDTFHKRDGDKYGYEKHSEFGQEHKKKIDDENEKGIKEAEQQGKEAEDAGEESRKAYAIFDDFNEDQKKQPKKKVESDYYGEGGGEGEGGSGGSGGSGYYSGGESAEGDGEGGESSESSEGAEGDGEGENDEYGGESEESEEGEEDDEY